MIHALSTDMVIQPVGPSHVHLIVHEHYYLILYFGVHVADAGSMQCRFAAPHCIASVLEEANSCTAKGAAMTTL